MKPARIRSLVFFVLLFAVAAMALDASYTQGRGSAGDGQKKAMPQAQQQGQMQKGTHQKGPMSQQQKQLREQMPDQAMYGHEFAPNTSVRCRPGRRPGANSSTRRYSGST